MPTPGGLSVLHDLPFLISKSIGLDSRTLRLSDWSRRHRATFIASKYRALTRVVLGSPGHVLVDGRRFLVREMVDVGTLQGAIVDIHEMLGHARGVLTDTPVVVDAGAHRGEFAYATKNLIPGALVYSFEPDPDVHADLQHNAALWSGIATRCVALGDRNATMPLYRSALSVMTSLRAPAASAGSRQTPETIDVAVVTLDDACLELTSVDLLKVDVEGFEDAVLAGARDLLDRTRLLLLEVGLARPGASNLKVLAAVYQRCPQARIIAIGRPLGDATSTLCQDVLIDLRPEFGDGNP